LEKDPQRRYASAPGLAHAAAIVQGLRPARAQKRNGAEDPSRGTSGRSWKGRDLLSDSRFAVAVAPFPKPAAQFRKLSSRQKEDGRLASGTTPRRDHKY